MNEMEKLSTRIAALEAKLADGADKDKDEDKAKEASDGRKTLASEIVALERRLAAVCDECGKPADECECEEDTAKSKKDDDKKSADDTKDEDKKDEDKKDDEKKASEVDPSGIEEEITQDKFTEVEKITHGKELATGPSVGAVSPTRSEYVAKMKMASVRLD